MQYINKIRHRLITRRYLKKIVSLSILNKDNLDEILAGHVSLQNRFSAIFKR